MSRETLALLDNCYSQ